MNKLLIATPDATEYAEILRRHDLPSLEIATAGTPEDARPQLRRCDIILGKPAMVAELIDGAENVGWVQSTFAGVDALLQPGLRRDYTLTGVKDIFGPLMSEYVFGHIIARERQLVRLHEQQRRREWQPLTYSSLEGRTMGIMGLGSIGRHIAGTATHFGLRVHGLRRTGGEVLGVDRVFTHAELEEFLAELDYLVVTLPHTAETEHLVNARVLRTLPGHAVLVNVGRGSVVDEPALIEALQQGEIAGAVLDVFEEEPLPAESPLWDMPQVTVTPHIAADSFPGDIARIFVENYRRFAAGEPLRHVIDFERGY